MRSDPFLSKYDEAKIEKLEDELATTSGAGDNCGGSLQLFSGQTSPVAEYESTSVELITIPSTATPDVLMKLITGLIYTERDRDETLPLRMFTFSVGSPFLGLSRSLGSLVERLVVLHTWIFLTLPTVWIVVTRRRGRRTKSGVVHRQDISVNSGRPCYKIGLS